MLPSEPLRAITSVNGNHSNDMLGKLTMENGECSFTASATKYKRRKVSAVRNFPSGCGRFPQNVSLRPTEDTDTPCTDLQNSNCKEGSIDNLENGTSDLGKDSHQLAVATQTKGMGPVLSVDNFLLPTENTDTAFTDNLLNLDCKEGSSDGPKNGTSDLAKDLHHVTTAIQKEQTAPVLLDDDFLLRTENTDTACTDTLPNSNCKEGSSDGLKNGTYDLVKDLHQSVASTKEEMGPVLLDVKFPFLLIGPNSVPNGNVLEKIVPRKYPPRRRVSAIRDFPPFCGRNGSKLTRDTVQPKDSLDVLAPVKNKSSGQEKSGPEIDDQSSTEIMMDDKSLTEIVNAALKGTCEELLYGDSHKTELEEIVSKVTRYEVRPEQAESNIEEKRKKDECGISSERIVEQKEREINNKTPFEDKLFWWDHEFETVVGKDDGDVEGSEENLCQEIVVYSQDKSPNEMLSVTSGNQSQVADFDSLVPASDRVMVQGLMAASHCPWRQGKGASISKPASDVSGSKGKKVDGISRIETPKSKSTARTKVDRNDLKGKLPKKISPEGACQHSGQLVIWDKEKSLERNDYALDVAPISRVHIDIPPLRHGTSSSKDHNIDATVTRNQVRETLRLFQAVCRKLLQEEEAKSKLGKGNKRIDHQAAKILKDKDKCVNTGKQILGAVPGVEVGDEFQYRVELNIIGLHRQTQGGIDYVRHGAKILATSIVASGGYSDDLDNSDVLVYTGQGGNVMNSDKEPEDQKLERGNLALKNSIHEKNPVRVIRGCESLDGRSKTYVYDGLYLVEKFWQELGPHGKLVFKFQLERIPGQPELAWKEVKKSKKLRVREGVCVDDISGGKEILPICAVNTINDEKPPPFKYITSLIYPEWYHRTPPEGCNCISGCSDSEKCSCAIKNGGEIPFNFNGAIVEAKSLVYECGPSCKCPPSCHNRVSQNGIKFQLEIFKTNLRGWGVRSLNFIPSGSFICEYIGEILKEKEAEERAGNDEYLFDVGNNFNDNSLWGGLSTLMPDVHSASSQVVEDGGFTIDAAEYGNIGRFVNHSCNPNLYAQNVLYDHNDKRIPHIMLFAAENIPPLQELTYHYNYTLDEVRDSNGNIKKKSCFCGSADCTGRLY